jgi:hypothetical protein
MKKIMTILFFLVYYNCDAQTIIKGKVMSVFTNKPEAYVTVRAILNSFLISGTETDAKGNFELKISSQIDSILLVFSCFGYEDTKIPLIISNIVKLEGEFIIGRKFKEEELILTKEDAELDIRNGKIQFYLYALPIPNIDILNQVAQKYGFQYVPINLPVNQNVIQSVEQYNSVIQKFLEKQNGRSWNERFKKDLKKISCSNVD